jgi:hypothetical protein
MSFLTDTALHYCLPALAVVNSGSNEGNEVSWEVIKKNMQTFIAALHGRKLLAVHKLMLTICITVLSDHLYNRLIAFVH